MATANFIGVAEYLHLSDKPASEYVDGAIVNRTVPNEEHSAMQGYLIEQLRQICRNLNFLARPELRIQTAENRFRIPNICVRDKRTGALFLAIEILSPDDPTEIAWQKTREYLAMGIPHVWLIDPVTRTGQIHTPERIERDKGGVLQAGEIRIDLYSLSD